MTIAEIDKRLAEIELWEPCQHTEEDDDRREDCTDCVDLAYFMNWRKALIALRAVLILCEKAEKAVSEMRVTSTSATIVVPIRDIRAAIDSAFEGEADV